MRVNKHKSGLSRLPGKMRMLVAGGLLMASLPSSAQWAVIETGPNFIQNLLSQLNTMEQKYEDLRQNSAEKVQWLEELEHYRQQLIALQSFVNSAMPRTDNFEARGIHYGVADECKTDGSLISNLWDKVMPNFGGDIVKEQRWLCERIVMAQNSRYNLTVDLLRKLRERDKELQDIEKSRGKGGTSQGELASNENDVNRFMASGRQELDYWQASNAAYDSYIQTLKEDQRRLARKAMRGDQGMAGAFVQGKVLSEALKKARDRDR